MWLIWASAPLLKQFTAALPNLEWVGLSIPSFFDYSGNMSSIIHKDD